MKPYSACAVAFFLAAAIAPLLLTSSRVLAQGETASEKPSEKLVFAHYMVAHRNYGSSVEAYQRDIAEAQAFGVDGFALNIGDWRGGNYKTDTALIFEAAQNTGFKLFLSADMNGGLSDADILDMVKTYAKNPAYFLFNGRPVLSTFGGEGNKEAGQSNAKSWWQNRVLKPLRAAGHNVYFVPFFYTADYAHMPDYANIKANFDEWWKDVCDGGFDFGAGALPSYNEPSLLRSAEARAKVFHDAGKTFMASVTPQYWGDKQIKDGRAYFEYEGGAGLEAQWNSIINVQKPQWVELVTWNDFGEHSYFSPIDDVNKYWPYADGAHPERGYYKSHLGLAALNKYFIRWYQSGVQPPITRDLIFYSYRTHPKDANPATDARRAVTKRVGPLEDVLYVTTMLTAPAILKINSGGVVENIGVDAGIVHSKIPIRAGFQLFELIRNHTVVLGRRGNDLVTASPLKNNFTYSTGVAGLNAIRNGGFDVEGPTQTPQHWSESATPQAEYSFTRAENSNFSPNHLVQENKGEAFQVSTWQKPTQLENGVYHLRAWTRSSGGQKTAQMIARGFDASKGVLSASIEASDEWRMISIPNVRVQNGQCEIAFVSDAAAGQWLNVDDVELVKIEQ